MKLEQKLEKLANEEKDIKDWLRKNKKSFCDAIGMLPFDDNMLILALAKLPDFFGGEFNGYKDDIDRAGCDVLTPFLRGNQVDKDELRIAVSLLIQRFNAACEANHQLRSRLMQIREQSFHSKPRSSF